MGVDDDRATTHTDLTLRARALGITTRVIHNASIINAVSSCGLQLYHFGQVVSLPFFTETWKPSSFYPKIKENKDLGLHTLVLLGSSLPCGTNNRYKSERTILRESSTREKNI